MVKSVQDINPLNLVYPVFSDYPELPNVSAWTRNTPEYCNSCTPNCPNTNILDGKL